MSKLTTEIICIYTRQGKSYGFQWFKESKVHCAPEICITGDSGYQGLPKIHIKTGLLKKNAKNKPLTKDDKQQNTKFASKRALNENISSIVKRFRIIAEKYRNRTKGFYLRFNLIAGIYNLELNL